jgi:uncharacterized protein involved in response to NO
MATIMVLISSAVYRSLKLMSSPTPVSDTAFQRPQWAFLATGFRPFFWFGAVMSAAWMFLWLLLLSSVSLDIHLPLPYWHAHEMLFGFVSAIIAGFLLTAAQNWTGRSTATGPFLLLLVLLWMAGRIVMLFGNNLPALTVITVDMAFIPCLLFFIARPIIATRHNRSAVLLVILGVLAACNLLFHLGWAGYLSMAIVPLALQITVDIITLLMVILGGRVIPFFTRNALPQASIHQFIWLDRLAIGSVVALLITETIPGMEILVGPIGLAAGGLNLARLLGWSWYKTLSRPILWILHLGYLWICAGLTTKGLDAYLPGDYRGIAIHLLTAGAMGTLILGMMSRVALGHTGRRLELPQGMALAYLLLTLAATARVSAPLLPAHITIAILFLSGGLWIAAFALFLFRYTAILWQPRIDGRPG